MIVRKQYHQVIRNQMMKRKILNNIKIAKTKQNENNEQPVQSQEQVNTQKQQMTQQPIQSQEKAEQSESEQQQNSQVANNEQSNVPAGDAMFGEYKEDGTYCTVGGCLTPEQ